MSLVGAGANAKNMRPALLSNASYPKMGPAIEVPTDSYNSLRKMSVNGSEAVIGDVPLQNMEASLQRGREGVVVTYSLSLYMGPIPALASAELRSADFELVASCLKSNTLFQTNCWRPFETKCDGSQFVA